MELKVTPKILENGFPSPCGVRRVGDQKCSDGLPSPLKLGVSVPLRGKEGGGLGET